MTDQKSAFARAVGDVLREQRKAHGWTRPQAAPKLHVSPQTIATHEYGTRDLPLSHLLRYSDLYGCSPADIIATAYARITTPPVTVDLQDLAATDDARLTPLRGWAAARLRHAPAARTVLLDEAAIQPYAARCAMTPRELLDVLAALAPPCPADEEEPPRLRVVEPPPRRRLRSVR